MINTDKQNHFNYSKYGWNYMIHRWNWMFHGFSYHRIDTKYSKFFYFICG